MKRWAPSNPGTPPGEPPDWLMGAIIAIAVVACAVAGLLVGGRR